ncbi:MULTISPECIES: aminoacyltransferase [Streptococcus]|uniref:Aminoacyltransferase n=1 Tax=Streptococcus caledonicus TaxID=2614158 RepID=A0ABW0UB33_9STRE|nr:aminoacyltransferase [Streptococcus sp. S784/96/1]
MLTYQIGISTQEHDDFVKSNHQVNLLQSSNWAKIKDNWSNERIGFYQDGKLVASASILIKPLPLGFTMLYIPRGPIMDYTDKELVSFVLKSLKSFGKKRRALFIKFDPNIHLQAFQDIENRNDNSDSLAIIQHLQNLGVEWVGRTQDIGETIQPRFQANVYAKDFSLDSLPKRTKQEIRTARNKGLEVVFGGSELLPTFAELMKMTENRKKIHLRNLPYYQKLVNTYPDDSFVTLVQIDVFKKIDLLKKQLKKAQAEFEKFSEKTSPGKLKENQESQKRLEKELDFFQTFYDKGQETIPLAATLSINFSNTSENLYAGMDDTFKQFNAPVLTWYETMNHAFELGMASQNMGGIENQLEGGLYHFKSKFNPTIEEFIGEFNLPVNALLYRLSNLAYKLRKQLRRKA